MSAPGPDEAELLRKEAAAAFAHEIRTPLTSLTMAIELARSGAPPSELRFDADLAALLQSAIQAMQDLADAFQETTRLERGREALKPGEHELGTLLERVREAVEPLKLEVGPVPETRVQWDGRRMVRALAGLLNGANRAGDGSGLVVVDVHTGAGLVRVRGRSGIEGGGAERRPGADAGYGFYAGRAVVVAHGGQVRATRRDSYALVAIEMPLAGV